MGGACVGGVSPARGHVQRGDAAGGESSRVEVISQTPAAANLDFINLIEVVDESAATAVRERLKALVPLSAFLGGERQCEHAHKSAKHHRLTPYKLEETGLSSLRANPQTG